MVLGARGDMGTAMEVWIAAVILENHPVVLGGIRWSLSLYPVPSRRAILTPAHVGRYEDVH